MKVDADTIGKPGQTIRRSDMATVVKSGVGQADKGPRSEQWGNFLEKLLPDNKPLEQNGCRAMSSSRSLRIGFESKDGFKTGNFTYL